MKELMNNPYAWAFLSLCTIISLAFAIYTWVAGKKTKEISISYLDNKMIGSVKLREPRLKITFAEKEIRNLTSSYIYIWNSGNDTIYADDIVATKLLEFESRYCDILDAKIIRQSNDENSFSIYKFTQEEVCISFEYMESGEGITLQVLYTDSMYFVRGGLAIESKIKNGKPIRYYDDIRLKQEKFKFFGNCIKLVVSLAVFAGSCAILEFISGAAEMKYEGNPAFLSIPSICVTILLLFVGRKIKKKIRNAFHRDVPEVLKEKSSS